MPVRSTVLAGYNGASVATTLNAPYREAEVRGHERPDVTVGGETK